MGSTKRTNPQAGTERYRSGRPVAARILLIIAGLMVAAGSFLPVWGMTMLAPQYRNGLVVHVYPGDLQGDVGIINVLNHYVGMRELHVTDFPEIQALPYILGLMAAGLILAGLSGNRRIALIMVIALILTGVGGVATLQYNLYTYGTSLDPMAPLDLDPFVPLMVGEYQVWNFQIHSAFMSSTYLLGLAALLSFLGLRMLSPPGTIAAVRRQDARHQAAGQGNQANAQDQPNKGSLGGRAARGVTGLMLGLALLAQTMLGPGVHAAGLHTSAGNSSPTSVIEVTSHDPGALAAALAGAPADATVYVKGGAYTGPLLINRGLQVIGDGETVIIGAGDLVTLQDGARLQGFILRHTGTRIRADEAAVRVLGRDNYVDDNTIHTRTAHGIYVERGGGHTIVANRILGAPDLQNDDRGNGVHLFDTEHNLVKGNRVENVREGLYLSFALNDTIEDNVVTGSRYGLHAMYAEGTYLAHNLFASNIVGSAFMFSRGMNIEANTVVNHTGHRGYGVLLKDANRNTLTNNHILGNHYGLFADQSDNNQIYGNSFSDNSLAIHIFSSSTHNQVWGNAFVGNRVDTRLNMGRHQTVWYDTEAGGNYWDRYQGLDVDGQGFGTVPHTSSDPFGYLTRNHPELQAFLLGPAVTALEWAEQAFPILRVPRVEDARPLVRRIDMPPPHPEAFAGTQGASSSPLSGRNISGFFLLGGGGVLLFTGAPRATTRTTPKEPR